MESDEEFEEPADRRVLLAQAGFALVVVIALAFFLANRDGDGDKPQSPDSGATTETETGKQTAATGGEPAPSSDPAWPTAVSGRPAGLGEQGVASNEVTPTAAPGVYLWNDFFGWHLWLIPGPGLEVMNGSITSNEDFAEAKPAVEGQETVTSQGTAIIFELSSSSGGIVGVDFAPGFFSGELIITVSGETGPIDPGTIFTGSDALEAPFPLVISKTSE